MDQGVKMSALVNYNRESEVDINNRKTEVIECYMEGPEDIKWSVQVNETRVAGVKSINTGGRLELVIHINLEKETKEEEMPAIR